MELLYENCNRYSLGPWTPRTVPLRGYHDPLFNDTGYIGLDILLSNIKGTKFGQIIRPEACRCCSWQDSSLFIPLQHVTCSLCLLTSPTGTRGNLFRVAPYLSTCAARTTTTTGSGCGRAPVDAPSVREPLPRHHLTSPSRPARSSRTMSSLVAFCALCGLDLCELDGAWTSQVRHRWTQVHRGS